MNQHINQGSGLSNAGRNYRPLGVRVALFCVSALYSVGIILLHDRIQQPALDVQAVVGMPVWHGSILALLTIGLGTAWSLRSKFKPFSAAIWKDRTTWILFALLCVIAGAIFMVNAIEYIHIAQYALLVFLLALGFRNVYISMFCAILVGIADEFYQFWILHSWQGYLDFNDLVFNTLGAVFGVLLLRAWVGSSENSTDLFANRNEVFSGWVLLFGVCAALFLLPSLSLYVAESGVFLHRHAAPESYTLVNRWIDTGWGNHWFILSVWESVVLVWGLPFIVFFSRNELTD